MPKIFDRCYEIGFLFFQKSETLSLITEQLSNNAEIISFFTELKSTDSETKSLFSEKLSFYFF